MKPGTPCRKTDFFSDESFYSFFYPACYDWFHKKEARLSLLKYTCRLLPYLFAASYLYLLFLSVLTMPEATWLKILLIPGCSFLLISLLRNRLSVARPYERFSYTPLLPLHKTGHSLPSRHTFSAGIIAMSWLYCIPAMGIFLWIMTLLLGSARIIGGVHTRLDVLTAIFLSILMGWVGFWLL